MSSCLIHSVKYFKPCGWSLTNVPMILAGSCCSVQSQHRGGVESETKHSVDQTDLVALKEHLSVKLVFSVCCLLPVWT